MLTGLANLGPPLRGQADMMTAKSSKSPESAGSFDRVLKTKSNDAPRMAGIKNKDVIPSIKKNEETPKTKEEGTESKETTGVEKAEEPNKSARNTGVKTKNKDDVMLDFMDSMESEFGIAPEQIVGALASVSDQSLSKSPEVTASEVVEKLNLPPEDQAKAEDMYLSFLSEMSRFPVPAAAPAMTPQVQSMPLAEGQPQYQPEFMAKANNVLPTRFQEMQKRSQLNASLDRMNDSFFMTNQVPAVQATKLQAYQDQQLATEAIDPALMDFNQSLENQIPLEKEVFQRTPKDLVDTKGQMELPAEMQAVEPDLSSYSEDERAVIKSLTALGAAATALGQMGAESADVPAKVTADNLAQPMWQGQMAQNPVAGMMKNLDAGGNFNQQGFDQNSLADKADVDTLSKDAGAEFSMPNFSVDTAKPESRSAIAGSSMAAGMAAGSGLGASPVDERASTAQVINQAQYLIKKGGGEAKVQMTPEGLGTVHLKVTVNEGKVGIEMATETKEAKKAIESSLSELKHGLSANRLHLDSIKVDMGQLSADSQKNSDPQQNLSKQPDMNQNENRDQARQFWQGFRDENFARQQSFYHPKDGSQNSSGRSVAPLTAEGDRSVNSASSKVSRYAAINKGKGLDLVA